MNSLNKATMGKMSWAKKNDHTSRRDFLKKTGFSGMALLLPRRFLNHSSALSRASFLEQIGVCTSQANRDILEASGCAYIEEGVRNFLAPDGPEETYEANLKQANGANIPVRACNGFLPGALKAVGADTKHPEILAYAETAFRRAGQAGIETIVWGSGESRKIPDGFSRAAAEEQFIDLARKVSVLAGRYGVTIALEPLNSGETNFINSLKEGAAVVEAVDHPSFRLLADIYHLLRGGETSDAILAYGKFLRHCHIAEKEKRTPPGVLGDDFRPFLKALRAIDYRGRMSIECRFENLKEQLPAAVGYLKKQIAEVSAL